MSTLNKLERICRMYTSHMHKSSHVGNILGNVQLNFAVNSPSTDPINPTTERIKQNMLKA